MHRSVPTIVVLLLLGAPAVAQQGSIVKQERDKTTGDGYTVLRVWGTPQEMGYAQGFLLAPDALKISGEIKSKLSTLYSAARSAMATSVWKPADLEQELEGMVAGLKAARPDVAIDVDDLRVLNTLGDWLYFACRSHSTWGSFVQGTTRTLTTRRLDFSMPVPSAGHHVLVARAPSDGGVRWLNVGWAGMVTSVTGVNEYGTVASLHDYESTMAVGAHMPRMVAARYALTMVGSLPIEEHLDAVFAALQKQSVMTGTFITYYVPEGHGGVITCPAGGVCTKKRVPQAGYFGGEVLLTTNQETDGLSAPSDDNFMDAYYRSGGPKSLADHYGLMGHTGLHLLSVDYRGRNDMTLWAEGRTGTGVTPTIKLEWTDLFPDPPPPGPGPDSGAVDAGVGPVEGSSKGSGCSYGGVSWPAPGWMMLLPAALGFLFVRRRLRRCSAR